MQSKCGLAASTAVIVFCLSAVAPRACVSAMAVDATRLSSEEGLVDRLASGGPDVDLRNQSAARAGQALPSATDEASGKEAGRFQEAKVSASPANSAAGRQQYLTSTDYAVPMRSRMPSQQQISSSEISVYVAIGVLTVIAVALVIIGSVFCYKYSAALRAADRSDPGGRQPIVFGSRSSNDSGSSGVVAGDTKLAVHAQKSYYQRQKQNIASAFKPRIGPPKSPIQEEDSDLEDSNVYGYPGLASTNGLEVNNPIFAGPASDEE